MSLFSNWFVQCPVCHGSIGLCGGVDSHVEVVEEHLIEVEMDHYLAGIVLGVSMGVQMVQAELETHARNTGGQGFLQALGHVDAMVQKLIPPNGGLIEDTCVEEGLCARCSPGEGDECGCAACLVRYA